MFIKNNKIFRTLSTFSRKEWLGLMTYCNEKTHHKALLNLLSILEKSFPSFELSKTTIHGLLFPESTYDDLKLRQLFHRLQKITEDYLIQQHAQNDANKDLLLAKHFKSKNLEKQHRFFQDKLLKKQLANIQIQDFKTAYYLETEKMDVLEAKMDRSIEPNLQNVHFTLDKLYLAEKIKLACSAINYSRINKHEYDLGFIEDIEEKIQKYITPSDISLFALYQTYLFTRYDKEEHFDDLQRILQENEFKKNDVSDIIFTMSINYCIRKINALKPIYFEKLFRVYKAQLTAGCSYDDHGQISPVTIRNILTVALRLKEYEWSEHFVNSHHDKLPILHREDNYNYLMARIHYVKHEYKQSMRLLAQSEPTDFLNNITSRVLLSKCYYETDEYDLLDNSLENFRIYLLRHKNKGYHFIFHVNFIKYLKQIVKAKYLTKTRRTSFLEKLKSETQIAEKAWLLEIAS